MKIVKYISLAALLSGCASVSQHVVTLENGQKREIVHSRSGVDFFDCGTQQLGFLFDAEGNLLAHHSERGEAFHCGFFSATVDGLAGQAASAVILTKGASKIAQAAGNAASEAATNVTITNGNTNNAEGYYNGSQSFTQSGGNGLGGVGGSGGAGGVGGSGGSGGSGGNSSSHGVKGAGGHKDDKSAHGNNGKGNGGHDGSPNGKDDNDR